MSQGEGIFIFSVAGGWKFCWHIFNRVDIMTTCQLRIKGLCLVSQFRQFCEYVPFGLVESFVIFAMPKCVGSPLNLNRTVFRKSKVHVL